MRQVLDSCEICTRSFFNEFGTVWGSLTLGVQGKLPPVALHDLTWFYELSLVVDVLHSTVIILQVLCMSAYYKATVNEIHVSGHPPARNFNGRINWSLLVTYVIIGHVI